MNNRYNERVQPNNMQPNNMQMGNEPQMQPNNMQMGNDPQMQQNDMQMGNEQQMQPNNMQMGNNPQMQPNNMQIGNVPQMQNKGYINNMPMNNYHNNGQQSQEKVESQSGKKKVKTAGMIFASLFLAGVIAIAAIGTGSPVVERTPAIEQAIESGVSTSAGVGTILFDDDESVTNKDYTIEHDNDGDEAKIWIWDYAAEDGDYVQVLVDGVAVGDAFMIKNKPVEIKVPTTGKVEIVGVRDGGGGITYAVNYEVNGTTYFNGTDVDASNTYTLVRKN